MLGKYQVNQAAHSVARIWTKVLSPSSVAEVWWDARTWSKMSHTWQWDVTNSHQFTFFCFGSIPQNPIICASPTSNTLQLQVRCVFSYIARVHCVPPWKVATKCLDCHHSRLSIDLEDLIISFDAPKPSQRPYFVYSCVKNPGLIEHYISCKLHHSHLFHLLLVVESKWIQDVYSSPSQDEKSLPWTWSKPRGSSTAKLKWMS